MDLKQVIEVITAIRNELAKVIIGQDAALDQTAVAILAGGHVLLEGPPGTAKTLLVRALSMAVAAQSGRIQFTPDLMPADIVGVNIYQGQTGQFAFRPGPLFCDLLLADEINRAPAKTQSALLEAMQENQVSLDGQEHRLSPVFTTLATQNPIEYEGTYPLPEAQLDRFMFKVQIGYPADEAEQMMLERHQSGFDPARTDTFGIDAQASVEQLAQMREAVRQVHVATEVLEYIKAIVRATRQAHALMLGASPRAGVMLLAAGRALAVLRGRDFVIPDDVRDLSKPTLRHRVVLNPEAEIEGTTADACIDQVLQRIPVPRLV